MKLAEVARDISAHLKRFESDPVINRRDPKYDTTKYYYSNAWAAGSRVKIRYVTYQGESSLTKQEAMDYLVWLNQGGVGRHYEFQRQARKEAQ